MTKKGKDQAIQGGLMLVSMAVPFLGIGLSIAYSLNKSIKARKAAREVLLQMVEPSLQATADQIVVNSIQIEVDQLQAQINARDRLARADQAELAKGVALNLLAAWAGQRLRKRRTR